MADANPALWVPPEDGAQDAALMMWPNARAVYHDSDFLEMTQAIIADLASTISTFQPVYLLADRALHGHIAKRVSRRVELWDVPTEDLWCRDAGPLVAFQGNKRVVSHLKFNGWGGRQVHRRDAQVATRCAQILGLPIIDSGLTGDAGGVEHDGHGLLMAHLSSWVNDNRNPGLSRDKIETRLKSAYGATRMIWSKGVSGADITDYHIDSLARFTGPGKVLVTLPDRPLRADPFHRAAIETHDALVAAGLDVQVIPEPEERRMNSRDFVASYANYFVCNGAVIASGFGDAEADRLAARALAAAYPGREIVMLNTDPLGELGGGIHCATQQIPAG